MKDINFVIADPASSRQSIRKMLSYFKVKPYNIDMVESFSDAKAFIENKKPNVVFADYSIAGPTGFDLVELFQKTGKPLRAFFLISSKDSNVMVSGAAEEE